MKYSEIIAIQGAPFTLKTFYHHPRSFDKEKMGRYIAIEEMHKILRKKSLLFYSKTALQIFVTELQPSDRYSQTKELSLVFTSGYIFIIEIIITNSVLELLFCWR